MRNVIAGVLLALSVRPRARTVVHLLPRDAAQTEARLRGGPTRASACSSTGPLRAPARHEWVKKYERMTDADYQKYFEQFNRISTTRRNGAPGRQAG